MKIEHLSPKTLKPYENNPREIPKSAVEAVKASITKYGFQNPIVVDSDNVIIAGHTRLKASLEMGLETVPVNRVTNLSPKLVRELRIVDNRTSEAGEWDFDKLVQEVSELNVESLIGFNSQQMDDLVELAHLRDTDVALSETDQVALDGLLQDESKSTEGTVTLRFEVPESLADELQTTIQEAIAEALEKSQNENSKHGA